MIAALLPLLAAQSGLVPATAEELTWRSCARRSLLGDVEATVTLATM